MSQKIKWGILGTSFISEVMAQAIQDSETAELVAIASRSAFTAKSFAEKFNIGKTYTDYHALLNDKEIDAIYIGLPNHLHKEWMLHAANAGKHILCEKPFVISVEEAREVINNIEKNNVFCMEALMYRHHPLINKLQAIVTEKMLGDIKLYSATYTAHIADVANPIAGGAIRNLGCYPISLIRLLANAEPIEIIGSGRINTHYNNDSQASVILKFADDAMAVVTTADDLKMTWQFTIHGTEGSLEVITNPWLPTQDNNTIIIKRNNEDKIELNITAKKPLYSYQIDVVGESIKNGNFSQHDGILLVDSLKNTIVLETWREQVVNNHKQPVSVHAN